jgi:competence protein ComGC
MPCSNCGAAVADVTQPCPKCGSVPAAQQGPAAAGAALAPTASDAARSETDIKAVLSLFLGVLSFVLSVFTGIPAVILGHISRASIRKSGGRLKGEGIALGGLIMGYISVFLVPVVLMILYVAVPNVFRARIVTNESSAISTLKTINVAAESYRLEHQEYPANLQELGESSLVALDDNLIKLGVKDGYQFTYSGHSSQKGYMIHADPVFIHTGQRHFYTDRSGIIRYETDASAGPGSASLEP